MGVLRQQDSKEPGSFSDTHRPIHNFLMIARRFTLKEIARCTSAIEEVAGNICHLREARRQFPVQLETWRLDEGRRKTLLWSRS
jgi:hypothetical protein